MRNFARTCIVSLSVILSGCATLGGAPENLAAVPPGKGLALFSTGADKTSVSQSTSLVLVQGSTLKKYNSVNINLDYPFASDFPGEHGHLRALALPPGDYYLLPNAVNPYFVTTKGAVYRFRVAEGAISYIGNFHLSGNLLSWSETRFKRDADAFLAKNPALAGMRIEAQKVEVAGDVGGFQTKGIIWEKP